jgi:hypothetical protein
MSNYKQISKDRLYPNNYLYTSNRVWRKFLKRNVYTYPLNEIDQLIRITWSIIPIHKNNDTILIKSNKFNENLCAFDVTLSMELDQHWLNWIYFWFNCMKDVCWDWENKSIFIIITIKAVDYRHFQFGMLNLISQSMQHLSNTNRINKKKHIFVAEAHQIFQKLDWWFFFDNWSKQKCKI